MKITFNQATLMNAVSTAMYCVSAKNTVSAAECILFTCEGEKVVLSSYDLEKGMRIEIDAEIEEEGKCVLNAQSLSSIIRLLPAGTVSITVNDNYRAKISAGKSEFEINSLDPMEFPTIPALAKDIGFKIKQGDMKSMIAQTLFAVAQNDARATFNGAYFTIKGNRIVTVGCDSYRLAVREKLCDMENLTGKELDMKFIIPGKTLGELIKLLDSPDEYVGITINQKQALFSFPDENMLFYSRLIDGDYIDYERIIPKNSSIFVEIDTEAFVQSLSRASLVSDDSTGKNRSFARCRFADNMLEITSISTSGSVRDEVQTNHTGGEIEIGFNCRYLMDALKASDTETLKLSMSTPNISMMLTPVDEEPDNKFLFLVLPIKLR